jgi:predicted nucleic acid-binding protein
VTTIVIDASVAVKWVLRETGSDAADALLDDHDLIAPALWLVESGNALWRRARIGEITADEAKARLSELRNAPVVSLAIEPHVEQALDLAVELGHPVYDCLYLTVALRHQTQMVTADRRFAAAVNGSHFSGIVRLLAP